MEARRREQEEREHQEAEQRARRERVGEYLREARVAEHPDLVHWGPVWVGLITAYGVLIVLGLLALAVGLGAVGPPTPGAPPPSPGVGAAIASVIAVLISFFAGGWIAGRTTSSRGRTAGIIHGTAVWALGLVLLMLMTALGVGGLLNVYAGFIGTFGGVPMVPGAVVGAAITTLIGVVLTWLATVAGAVMGATTPAPEIEQG